MGTSTCYIQVEAKGSSNCCRGHSARHHEPPGAPAPSRGCAGPIDPREALRETRLPGAYPPIKASSVKTAKALKCMARHSEQNSELLCN